MSGSSSVTPARPPSRSTSVPIISMTACSNRSPAAGRSTGQRRRLAHHGIDHKLLIAAIALRADDDGDDAVLTSNAVGAIVEAAAEALGRTLEAVNGAERTEALGGVANGLGVEIGLGVGRELAGVDHARLQRDEHRLNFGVL